MSQGKFEQGVYEADSGELHVIRYQPETSQATFQTIPNSINSGAATSPFWAKITKSKREYGLNVRKVRCRWTSTAPAGYKPTATFDIVVFQPSVFNGITINSGGLYLGEGIQVIGKTSESIYPEI